MRYAVLVNSRSGATQTEGGIYGRRASARKNGIYYVVLTYKTYNGKRKTKWQSTGLPIKGNKRRAEAMMRELQDDFEPPVDPNGPPSKAMLFADYLVQWLEIAKSTVKLTTYSSYKGLSESQIIPYFRSLGVTLGDLKAVHIQSFYQKQLERVKPNTVVHYHAIIHRALKYAVKTDLIDVNPADKVDRPKKNEFTGNFCSREEMNALFDAVRGNKIEVPVMLAAFYGLRRSEVVGLKWDAVDFEQNTLEIRHTVATVRLDGKKVIVESDTTKTKASKRTMPLVPVFRERLLALQAEQKENRKLCGRSYNKKYDGYICVDPMGNLLLPNALSDSFQLVLRDYNLRRIRFHDLRHPYVKHTTKIFSLRLMDFQAQAYPDARRKTRGACQLLRVGQSRSPVRPLCNRKRFSCLPPQSKMSWILYAISMRLSGYTSTRSISSSASSVVSVSASKIALDASMRLSCRACSSCFCFACANTAA